MRHVYIFSKAVIFDSCGNLLGSRWPKILANLKSIANGSERSLPTKLPVLPWIELIGTGSVEIYPNP